MSRTPFHALLTRAARAAQLADAVGAPTDEVAEALREARRTGAGIAGLTAAWRLRQGGVRVRIADAQTRIGGRMPSLRDFFPDGQVAELGGELIDSNHVRITPALGAAAGGASGVRRPARVIRR
jgi:monoamine oxidase